MRGEEVKPNENEATAKRRTARFTTLESLLRWGDAISIGAFCVIGANNGLRSANGNPIVAVTAGMFTASFSRSIRDTFLRRAGEDPALTPETRARAGR